MDRPILGTPGFVADLDPAQTTLTQETPLHAGYHEAKRITVRVAAFRRSGQYATNTSPDSMSSIGIVRVIDEPSAP